MAKRNRHGRAKCPPFVRLDKRALNSIQWHALSPKAVKMFIYLTTQYNGHNNGDISAAWSTMREKGWRSKGTLHDALAELVDTGWIRKTRQGGKNRCSLFAVGIYPIDVCNGQHDARPTTQAPNDWQGN